MRTLEKQRAIYQIQEVLGTDGIAFADEFISMLADMPAYDHDRAINNMGHLLMVTLKKTAPDLSEALQYGLPFAFTELVRERMGRPCSI
jgi:hypothetical protein